MYFVDIVDNAGDADTWNASHIWSKKLRLHQTNDVTTPSKDCRVKRA